LALNFGTIRWMRETGFSHPKPPWWDHDYASYFAIKQPHYFCLLFRRIYKPTFFFCLEAAQIKNTNKFYFNRVLVSDFTVKSKRRRRNDFMQRAPRKIDNMRRWAAQLQTSDCSVKSCSQKKKWSRHVWLLWQLRSLSAVFYYTIKILKSHNKFTEKCFLLFIYESNK
jgi:hypothetical protein